jgi:hypothetical protein
MRPQLKFLLPDIKTANQASEALLLAKIDNKNICFLAKPGTNLGELQVANTLESTNIINEGEKGILIGATIGLMVGLYTHFFQPWITASMHVHWMVLVGAIMILGAALSAIGAAVFGVNFFNDDLAKYKSKIDEGAILMIVSAPFQRSSEITKIVSKLHLRF